MANQAPEYEYKDEGGARKRRLKKYVGTGEGWEDDPGGADKTTKQIGEQLGYKAGEGAKGSDDDKYASMTDEEIAKLSPLMRASAKAKRKAAQERKAEHEGAKSALSK